MNNSIPRRRFKYNLNKVASCGSGIKAASCSIPEIKAASCSIPEIKAASCNKGAKAAN